jgi:Calcineurin-like phosphoesterase
MMISNCIINLRFHCIVALSLILFIFHFNDDLDVNPQYFENINGIEVAEAEDGFFIFDPNEYFEEDNVPQNSSKTNHLKQSENEINNNTNNSKVKISNKSEGNYKNNTNNKNTNDTNAAINQSTYISNHTSKDFNLVAVGDWDCTSETDDTVENIINQNPELVLALGDLAYNGKAKCWLELIEPVAEKTKIVIGNHEVDSSKLLRDYMEYFGLEEQYYSFNYENIHFLALSAEIPFEEDSRQYEFVVDDLTRYSNDTSIDWIIVFFHKQVYSSASTPENEEDFREVYHPLFDKYKVDLVLQGHLHAYERTYPITFNDDDENEPIIRDTNLNAYINPNGTTFLTAGTGGAHDMELSSLEDFSAAGVDGKFGILNINVVNNNNNNTNDDKNGTSTVIIGSFIENESDDEFEILDEFKITKTS